MRLMIITVRLSAHTHNENRYECNSFFFLSHVLCIFIYSAIVCNEEEEEIIKQKKRMLRTNEKKKIVLYVEQTTK